VSYVANTPVINSFNAGELSPYLYARNDLKKYNSGCLTLENFQALPYGGAVRRPAIQYIAEAKNEENVRLIEFEFSSEQTYVLEFGDLYVRFYKDGAQLVGAYSAWNATDVQVVGDLTIDTGSYYRCLIPHTAGAIDGTFATDLAAGYWVVTAGATDLAYEVPTPYLTSEVQALRVVQSADVMWICHTNHPVSKLSRFGDVTWTLAEEAYTFPVFREENLDATALLACSAVTGTGLTLTATGTGNAPFVANHVGSYWQLKHTRTQTAIVAALTTSGTEPPAPSGTLTVANSIIVSAGVNAGFNTHGTYVAGAKLAIWRSFDDGTTWEQFRYYSMEGRNVDTSWTAENEEAIYVITSTTAAGGSFSLSVNEAFDTGVVKVTGYTSSTLVPVDVIRTLGSTSTTAKWSEGAWSVYRGYPQAIALWESRLIFAGTVSDPNTIWLSTIDDFNNFDQSTLDDAASGWFLSTASSLEPLVLSGRLKLRVIISLSPHPHSACDARRRTALHQVWRVCWLTPLFCSLCDKDARFVSLFTSLRVRTM
jgi:hypothetical protein